MHSQCQSETETETECVEGQLGVPEVTSFQAECVCACVVARKFIHAPQVVGRGQMNDMAATPVRQLFRQLN